MWHNVLGPGGVRELLWLKRTESYVDKFLDHEPLTPATFSRLLARRAQLRGDRGGAVCEGSGIFTVAVTSAASAERPAEHSSGHRLSTVCDVTIDTGVPVQDAVVEIEGWAARSGRRRPSSPAS